ncbi:MAG: YciK family oxidoreductase [Porticoccaceae bacterium]|jgi:NAD(P)-dependent dehydrogenase (short-subunit alcohol dehydrogenase family)|nr:YciK family oxidoreductase [Porticoccaceae bacterium]|tara:strand:+ start:729 stop:1505 length:777 start_codon:yes stop_codon:yes gene_type:complete
MHIPTLAELQALPPTDALKGKVILITGAGDGLGKAAALDFSAQGAHVILLGRNQAKLEATYDEIEAINQSRPIIFPYDLNTLNPDVAREMAFAIEQEFGRLDGLLLNAAALGSKMSIAQYPEQQWLDVINTNLNSSFYLTKAMLPLLEASNAGRLVFTTSSVGRQGRAYWGAYGVSKFATEGLMQTLAAELGATTAIRTFAINPGATRTAMRASAYPGEDPKLVPSPAAHMPLYRFLMSDAADDYNGQSIDAHTYLTD